MIIEAVVIEYLKGLLEVPVVAESPEEEPESYVRVEKVGRERKNFIVTDSIAFQSYGASMYEAAALDEKVQELVPDMVERSDVSGVHLFSNYNATDTRKKQYRYQCIFDITHK